MTIERTTNGPNNRRGQHALTATGRAFIPGYSNVLIRQEAKNRLTEFRRGLPSGNDTHYERCLATALLEYALNALSDLQIEELLFASLQKDLEVTALASGRRHQEGP